MIARTLDALVARGFEETDARSRLALVELVQRRHQERLGAAPEWRWFVPGRIEIFGKHTDYAGGRSLLATVPRGFAVAAAPRSDDLVRVFDAPNGDLRILTVSEARQPQHGWLNYVATVVRRLTLNFPGMPIGADITFASDLPRASGLSSSSVLVIAVAVALLRRAGAADTPAWRETIRTPLDLAGYFGALERGASFGALAGTEAVGVFGGSEDHTAILTCTPGHVSAYRYQPVCFEGRAAMPSDWRFVIVSSGVIADKAGSARDAYNRASFSADALLNAWNRRRDTHEAVLAPALATEPDGVAGFRAALAPDLQRRLDHFLAEDRRVPAAIEAFARADASELGELSGASQLDAEALLRNQTPETSMLASAARQLGAFASCSFGAGFGGAVWALTTADDAAAFGGRWMAAYRAAFPQHQLAAWFTARPAPPLVELGE